MSRQVVARASEVAPGTSKIVTVKGREIGIFNIDGELFRARQSMSSRRRPAVPAAASFRWCMSDGPGHYRLARHQEFLRCPWHGWEFDIRTGQSWCDPNSTRARQFAVTVESGAELVKGPYVAETFTGLGRGGLPRHRAGRVTPNGWGEGMPIYAGLFLRPRDRRVGAEHRERSPLFDVSGPASVSAPMAPSFFPRRLCRPTCRAHRAGGGWHHSRLCPRDIRPPECRVVPWTSVPWTYSHSVKTSGSRVLRLRRSTRSKASRRSITHRNISARAGQVCQAV